MRLLAAFATAILLSTSSGTGQEFSLTLHRLQASDLPVKEAPFALYYSPGAEAEADRYAAALGEAVAWYRETIGWDGRFAMAVLDEADYERYAGQTYPVPYAEVVTGLVVMPDDISSFPGFDAWGLDAIDLNASLTLHEIGHAIAHDIGLWSSSHWVNELIANVFLAAYLRAERPDDRGLLDGVPPGFADAARTTNLVDLDDLYSGVGLDTYAWFQFRLAAMADFLVADREFKPLIAELTATFPAEEARNASVMPTPEEALRRLEAIAPGVSALAADLLGRPDVPETEAVACGPDKADEATGAILVENHANQTLLIDTREEARWAVRLDLDDTGLTDAERDVEIDRLTDEALATGLYAWSIPPNHRRVFREHPSGTQLYIAGGNCVIVPNGVARFVWTDG